MDGKSVLGICNLLAIGAFFGADPHKFRLRSWKERCTSQLASNPVLDDDNWKSYVVE